MKEELLKRDKKLKAILFIWLFIEIAIVLQTLTTEAQNLHALLIASIIALLFGLYLKYEFEWQERQFHSEEEQAKQRKQICQKFSLSEGKYTQVFFTDNTDEAKYPTYQIYAKVRKEKLILFAYSKTKRFGWFVELCNQEDWQEFSKNFQPKEKEFQLPKFL